MTAALALSLLIPAVAGDYPPVLNPTGFSSIDWVFASTKEDLFDLWARHGDNSKLKGRVYDFIDWPAVAKVSVIFNAWHLPATDKDIRLRHIHENLDRAAFGDRFKGSNPGGSYILLLQYKDSDRQVAICFKDGIFLIEGCEGIGAVDVRRKR